MSTCPTNEIHSLYLDNEMPQVYRAEYEAHIASCENCKKELEKMRKLHDLFAEDSKAISPDKQFVDESFNRLMTKMNYSKTTKVTSNKFISKTYKYVIPAVAVAAIAAFALIIPLGFNSKSGVKTITATSSIYSQIPTQVSTQLSNVALGNEKGMIISGNLKSVSPYSSLENSDFFVTNVSNPAGSDTLYFRDVDVFRPDFVEGEKSISIRITVPGEDDVPVTTEITVPLDVTGQF